jgi:hypothetical protein
MTLPTRPQQRGLLVLVVCVAAYVVWTLAR